MAFLKQILVTAVVLAISVGVWMSLDSRPGQVALGMLPQDQTMLRGLVTAISAHPAEDKIGATPVAGRQTRPPIVLAGSVGEARTRSRMRAIATAEAERSVVVYPDTTGLIAAIPLKSGDAMKAGDVLAVLENDTETLTVQRARIALDAAEEKFERYQRLSASRAVTTVETNDVARERDNARLDLRAAEVALAKRTIVAPLDGRVGIVQVEPGDLVSNQSVIATIDDRRRLRVVFFTQEAFVPELAIGQPVEAVATARPENVYKGSISAIDSRLDEASRTLRTEALLDNPADDLRPGMSFAVTLLLPGERQLAVDPLAVQWERDGAFVWKIVNNKVEKAAVRVVERTIDRMLISSTELRTGDHVVVEGTQSVREGGSVEVRNQPQPPAPPAIEEPGAPAAETRSEPPRRTGSKDGPESDSVQALAR